MKKILFNLFRLVIGRTGFKKYKTWKGKQHRHKELLKAREYLKQQDAILDRIKAKPVKRILFFVVNMGMWKYDGLIQLMKRDSRFDIVIVSFPIPMFDSRINKLHQKEIESYCKENSLKFIPGFNYETNAYADLSDIHPDIVSYTQPYNIGYTPWLIDSFKDTSLFIYTPYGASVTQGNYFYDTYLTNVAWKVFVGSRMEKEFFNSCLSVNCDNQIVTGYTIADKLSKPALEKNPWKSNRKHIIWAPHHSIDERFSFSSSNFERLCEGMVDIAKKYAGSIEFAFKPHPILKERLIEKWGHKKTEEYYQMWAEMPNTFICEGSYAELFAYSDGLIHDCASFVCEYLLTGKPALYVVKDSNVPDSVNNELGIRCFEQHYHAKEVNEIEKFIDRVILAELDDLKKERKEFVATELLPPNGCSVGENMMKEFENLTI